MVSTNYYVQPWGNPLKSSVESPPTLKTLKPLVEVGGTGSPTWMAEPKMLGSEVMLRSDFGNPPKQLRVCDEHMCVGYVLESEGMRT